MVLGWLALMAYRLQNTTAVRRAPGSAQLRGFPNHPLVR